MKTSNKILTTAFLLLLTFAICIMFFVRMNGETVSTETRFGKQRTINYKIEKLNEIDVAVGNVRLYQRKGKTKVEVSCGENLMETLDVSFDKEKLQVRMKDGFQGRAGEVEIIIYTNKLRHISLHNEAQLFGEGTLNFDTLNLTLQNNADAKITLQSQMVNTFIKGNSKLQMEGTAKFLNANVNNSGNVEAINLISKTVIANVSDAGKLRTSVEENLTANLSNAGKIYYQGEPEIQQNGVIDSAELIKL